MYKSYKNIATVILFSLVFFNLKSQTKKIQLFHSDTDSKPLKAEYYVRANSPTVKEGNYFEYYLNGSIKVKGRFKNDKALGPWDYFYEDGSIKMRANIFPNGESLWRYYFEDGTLKKEGKILNGKKSGEWKYYYENGQIKSSGNFKEGVKDGLWKGYYENSVLKSSSLYQNKRGIYKEYHMDGSLKVKGLLRNNHGEGVWEYYYPNGQLQAKGLELNGVKNGYWEYFYESGEIKSKGDYIGGKQTGEWFYYHENGALSSKGNHVKGVKDGHWKLYNESGAFKADGIYKLGDGNYKEYYESGAIKVSGEIKNEKNHGLWKYYYNDGVLEGECEFNDGEGDYVGYYKSGAVKTKGKLKDGNKIGDWVLYDEEGEVIGHYITLYDKENMPIYEDTHEVETLDIDTSSLVVQDTVKLADTTVVKSGLPKYRYHKKGKWKKNIRYFNPVNTHEYQGFIVSSNPLALINGELPIYLEYYYQERLGYQLSYTIIRRPFFNNPNNLDNGTVITRGFSVDVSQRFYSRNTDLGMVHFGHQFRYRDIKYRSKIEDINNPNSYFNPSASEKAYEYVVIIGNRIMQSIDYNGFTFDIYVGLGVGYRDFKESNYSNEQVDTAFDDLSKNSIYMPFRFGFSFGYTFQR